MRKGALCLFLLVVASALADNNDDEGTFFHMSDIHLDNIFIQSSSGAVRCRKPIDPPNEEGGQFGRYGCDAPWPLVDSMLNNMQSLDENPDFIVASGDFIAHNLLLPDQIPALKQVLGAIHDRFPNSLVIPTMGNNDLVKNYAYSCSATPDDRTQLLASMWRDWLGANATETFLRMGAYSVTPSPGLRVISLNTIIYSDKNVNITGDDPCGQFEWLTKTLRDAAAAGEKVYLTGHIPSGMDDFGSVPLWRPAYIKSFSTLLSEFDGLILAALFGHTHNDQPRFLPVPGTRGIPAYTVGGVTPVYNTNPMFRRFTYSKSTQELLDYEDNIISLYESNLSGTSVWNREYSFAEAYNVENLNSTNLAAVLERASHESVFFGAFASRQPGSAVTNGWARLCALKTIVPEEYDACVLQFTKMV